MSYSMFDPPSNSAASSSTTTTTTTSANTTKVETTHQALVDGVLPESTVSELSLAGATAAPWRQFDAVPTCVRQAVALFLPRSVIVPQADGDLNLCGCVSLSPFFKTQSEGSQFPRACDRVEGEGWTLKSRTLVSAVAGFGLMTNIALSNLNLASRLYMENRLRLSRTSHRRKTLLEPPLTNFRRFDAPENALIS